jgi:hypothetical protein
MILDKKRAIYIFLLAYSPYFEKIKVGLRDLHISVYPPIKF